MDKKNIISLLVQRGYNENSAKIVSSELLGLASPLEDFFLAWMEDPQNKTNFEVCGYSIFSLMEERKMTYPAAILTIDWLIKEPEKALLSLKRGIK